MPSWPIAEITKLLEPSLAHMGYSVYAIEQAGQGGRTLRIAIDKPDGFISLDDCQRVSEVAGPLLDQANLIPQSYTLEVSSPGAERPLRDRAEYERFVGHRVNVVTARWRWRGRSAGWTTTGSRSPGGREGCPASRGRT